jgi:carboxyl-terminal processing protease
LFPPPSLCLAAALYGFLPTTTDRAIASDSLATVASPPATPDDALTQALELERDRSWGRAIETYEKALRQWPERTDLRHRLRLCETHFRLSRRYQDRSFREVLLRLPSADVLALFDELIEKIETSYVEPVGLEPMLRWGFDNLEVALRDPSFLAANSSSADPTRVRWLREAYRSQRQSIRVSSRNDARALVVSACDLGAKGLGLPASAVGLEFVFGACDALDEYSGCLTPDRLSDLYAEIDGNFVGIGVELKDGERGLRIVHVLPGGPAADAGLIAGDEITHIEGQAIVELELDPAAALLQGKAGTSLSVDVIATNGGTRSLKLTRRPVVVQSVEDIQILADGVGYIRLTGFQKTTVEEMEHSITQLQKSGMKYLILDVRGNPGGLLNVAVDLADRFLDHGLIVATRGRASGQSFDYTARSPMSWVMPVTVLIDHDSASASEILAGALKDHHRALIIGERTYGKGSVQSIYPLRSADMALKLTTARFYSPTNRPYSEQGVEPDVVARVAAKPADSAATNLDSANLDPASDPVVRVALSRARQRTSARP